MEIRVRNEYGPVEPLARWKNLCEQVIEAYASKLQNQRLFRVLCLELCIQIAVTDGGPSERLDAYAFPDGILPGDPPEILLCLPQRYFTGSGSERSFALTLAHELTHIFLGTSRDKLGIWGWEIPHVFEEFLCNTVGTFVAESMDLSDENGDYVLDFLRLDDQIDLTWELMGVLDEGMRLDGYTVDDKTGMVRLDTSSLWYAAFSGHPEVICESWDHHMGNGTFEGFCDRLENNFHSKYMLPEEKEQLLEEIRRFRSLAESPQNAICELPREDLFKVALMQTESKNTVEENIKKAVAACHAAAIQDADVLLFPEMWTCGYTIPENPEELRKLAIPVEGMFHDTFSALAKELDTAIAITLLEQYEPAPRNTMCLFDRHGKLVMTYAKVHTCDFGDECRLTPGDNFYVADLNTRHGTVKVGAMICYDREFPESARILMLKGAEIILVPNACPMEINRLAQLRSRAYENMVGIATCNYPATHPDCNGHSSAFDGIAYREGISDSCDTCLIEAGGEVNVYMASFPIKQLREYRAREVHGNAYRRPEKYTLLTNPHIDAPFIRKDRRK